MKFSPKYKAKKLGMIYTILGSFAHFLIGKRLIFRIWPRTISGVNVIGDKTYENFQSSICRTCKHRS